MSEQRRQALRSLLLQRKDVLLFAGLLVLLGAFGAAMMRQASTAHAGALTNVQAILTKTAPSSTNTNLEVVSTLATALDPNVNNCSVEVTSTSCYRFHIGLPATTTAIGYGAAFKITGAPFATSTAGDGYNGCNGTNSDVCAVFRLPSGSTVGGGEIIITNVVTSTIGTGASSDYPDSLDVYMGSNTSVPAGTQVFLRFFNGRFTTPGFRVDHNEGYADFHSISQSSAICTNFDGISCAASSTKDTGSTFAAIIEPTTLTATINAAVTFSVSGLATSTDVYGDGSVLTSVGSTTTTCPFGTLTPNIAKTCAQKLQYTTTAQNGAIVYLTQDGNMTDGSHDIDQFRDGARGSLASPLTWTSPAANVADENTYGHLGYNSTSTYSTSWSDQTKFGGILTRPSLTSPVDNIFANSSQVPNGLDARVAYITAATSTNQITNVVYKIEVSSLQEAGVYSNEVQYQYVASF